MIPAVLVVIVVSLLSLIHPRSSGARRWAMALLVLALGGVAGVLSPGTRPWEAVAVVGIAAVWWCVNAVRGADMAVLWLVVAVAVLMATVAGPASANLAKVYAALAVGGVGLFLTHPANDVCRAVLDRARVPHTQALTDEAQEGVSHVEPTSTLRGGRFIGPLERWAVAALAVAGAQGIIVGLMAAKGIGRYPELAGDKGHGTKTEEFLIGSLVSWLLAAAAALFLHFSLS